MSDIITVIVVDSQETVSLFVDSGDNVTSFNTRTGAVVPVSGDYDTSEVTEVTNLYYTEARVTANTSVTANTAKTGVTTQISNVSEDTTPQAGGEFDLQAHSIGGTAQTATGDGTTTIDWKLGNIMLFQFGAFSETFTFTAPTKPGAYVLRLVQDSVGSRTATWPATVKWIAGTAPTLTTTATTGKDYVTFIFDGTNYDGVEALNFS